MLPNFHTFNSVFMARGAVADKLTFSKALVSRCSEEGKQVAAKLRCEYRQHRHTVRFISLLMLW